MSPGEIRYWREQISEERLKGSGLPARHWLAFEEALYEIERQRDEVYHLKIAFSIVLLSSVVFGSAAVVIGGCL